MNPEASQHTVRIVQSPYGRFAIDPSRDAQIFKHMHPTEHHAMDSIRLLEKLITKDSVVVDIGAHIGTVSVPLSYKAKKVIAFEPSPVSFGLLERNAELNSVTNIDLRAKGLGSVAGKASLDPMPEGNAGGQTLTAEESGSIEISTLDVEVEKAQLLKIDVEGMEMDVLRGATDLFEKSKPIVFMEIFPQALRAHGTSFGDIQRFFTCKGYTLYLPFGGVKSVQIGRIMNLFLIVALISPGSFFRENVVLTFDIVAIPPQFALSPDIRVSSSVYTLMRLALRNLRDKIRRLLKLIR